MKRIIIEEPTPIYDEKGNIKYYQDDEYIYVPHKSKKQEWDEEDEKMLNSIIKVVCGVGSQANRLREKQVNWLKSCCPHLSDEEIKKIRSEEYTKGFNDAAFGGKLKEWDTHDKVIVNCIVCCLDGQFVPEAARKQALEWFNKHRRAFLNHSSWKPSEELIGCLERVIAFKHPEPEDIDGCNSLIEQLKKLM